MHEYTVTIRLSDRDQFHHFVETVGPVVERLVISVKDLADVNEKTSEPAPEPAEPIKRAGRPTGPRGSKVNDTILAALDQGTKTVKELKEALVNANLAPGSLSTGLATLQRTGQVMRIQDGLYATTMEKAAE